MSWILGIDTSSADLSIGLIKEGKPHISFSRYVPNSHAEHITAAMKFVLESSGISASDISYAGVAVGPGSFTGLRIGISFLKGFFLKRNTLILPVSSLQSMVGAFYGYKGPIIIAMDARQERVFSATFKKEDETCKRVTEDTLLPADEFYAKINENDVILFDMLGYAKSTVFDTLKDKINSYSSSEVALQRGLACAFMAAEATGEGSLWKEPVDILPNYMQPSYAEKNVQTKRNDHVISSM